MEIIDVLTQKLRDLMHEHQIRAAPLARRAALNESAVRDILRGRSKNPGIVTLQKIAGVMNLRPSALFEEGEAWKVIGVVEADGFLNRDAAEPGGVAAIENPFLTTMDHKYTVVIARGAATSPLAYDGDYLIVGESTDAITDDILGRPAIVDAEGMGEIVCVPQVGADNATYHLAAINAFGAGRRDVKILRVAPIICALPARFAKPSVAQTHHSSMSVHEKQHRYNGSKA